MEKLARGRISPYRMVHSLLQKYKSRELINYSVFVDLFRSLTQYMVAIFNLGNITPWSRCRFLGILDTLAFRLIYYTWPKIHAALKTTEKLTTYESYGICY